MKENGLMIRLKAEGFICIKMELLILENGKMTSNMGMAFKNGQMALFMRATLSKD